MTLLHTIMTYSRRHSADRTTRAAPTCRGLNYSMGTVQLAVMTTLSECFRGDKMAEALQEIRGG